MSLITSGNVLNVTLPANETVGEIAAQDLGKAAIFKKYGIDFCCGGKKTVKEACDEKGIDVTRFELELQEADRDYATRPLSYGDWSLDFLADYIVNSHHGYVRKRLPDLRAYAAKVASVHGKRHPELKQILQLVEEINAELTTHMMKEEKVLFPYVKELVRVNSESRPLPTAHFGSVQNPISMMEMEHELVGKNFAEIRQISGNYSLPDDACASYTLLFKMLVDFEEDLHMHIHLENNILFPKALKLEQNIRS